MVKIERSFPAPASLAREAQKTNGSYNVDVAAKNSSDEKASGRNEYSLHKTG